MFFVIYHRPRSSLETGHSKWSRSFLKQVMFKLGCCSFTSLKCFKIVHEFLCLNFCQRLNLNSKFPVTDQQQTFFWFPTESRSMRLTCSQLVWKRLTGMKDEWLDTCAKISNCLDRKWCWTSDKIWNHSTMYWRSKTFI